MGYIEAVLADAPRGFWVGDDSPLTNLAVVKDYSATANNAQVQNANGLVSVPGALTSRLNNKAIQEYVGDNGAVIAPDVAALRIGGNAVSVEMFAKAAAPSASGYGYMYSKIDVGGSGSQGIIVRAYNGPPTYMTFTFGDGALSHDAYLSAMSPWDNLWHHIVCTWDGVNVRFYIDKVLRQTVPLAGVAAVANPMRSSRMFADQSFGATDFAGAMQAIAVYDKVLTPERIAAHFDANIVTLGLIEPIARNMRDVITAYIENSRSRVERSRGLSAGSIPVVAEITLGTRSNHAAYPAIEIEGVDHVVLEDAPDYMKSAFTIALVVTITAPVGPAQTSDPEEDLTLLTWRMEAIVVDAIKAAQDAHAFVNPDGLGYGVDFQAERIDYSPIRMIRDDLFARDIFIPTICTIEEVRT